MNTFLCLNCGSEFQIENSRKNEYIDPIYGSCWKYEADCPQCGVTCSEKPIPKIAGKSKSKTAGMKPDYCGQGGCCCN